MSNAKKPAGKPTSLAQYRAEAKAKTGTAEPFVLWLDDDESIEIQRPTLDQMFEAEEAQTSRSAIIAIAGDQAGPLLAAIGGEDPEVGKAVVEDIKEHFSLGE